MRVSCDAWCYRRQRFKPFGLISTRLVGYTILQVAEVQTLWLVGRRFLGTRYYRRQRFKPFGLVSVRTEASFNARHYRWRRFKPCGLISAHLRVLISASGRGSNPLACRTAFIWILFLWIGTGSNPVGLRSVWKLERVGSNPVA